MQLTKILLLAGLMLTTLALKPGNSPTNNVGKTIRESVKVPADLKAQGKKVEILFTTSQSGEVNFVLAKTNNSSLKKEIEKQFYTLRFAGLKENVVNSVTLNFKTL